MWKNLSTTKKGVIVGSSIGFIFAIIGTLCLPFAGYPSRCPPIIIFHLPLILLSDFLEDLFSAYIALILASTIMGALIGFIIGKIKSSRKLSSKNRQ